jgi:pyruvate formate lyase activating enzyme
MNHKAKIFWREILPYRAHHILDKCTRCGACTEIVACPGSERDICIGCGACALACPNQAIEMVEEDRKGKVSIEVNGKEAIVSEQISVKEALRELGYSFTDLPDGSGIFAPCQVGGCWSCMVEIDGVLRQCCVTEAREGMKIKTGPFVDEEPRRIVINYMGHTVGGVGTPRNIRKNPTDIIEVICFTAGCNFRCPQCQNWEVAYRGEGTPTTPKHAAWMLWMRSMEFGVNRMGVSGGESTLNRPWLIQFIKELRRLNPNSNARFHVDTNGSLLIRDYIDELVDAGMTDIGIDLKALNTDTFMRITGLEDRKLAQKYKEIAWKAVEHLTQNYKEKVFLGIGIPYNKSFISLEEIGDIGKRIYEIDPSVQVCANNYVPHFRSHIFAPTSQEMRVVYDVLKDTKLKTVLCQSPSGFIGL